MNHDPHIPEALATDLRRVYRGSVQVPGEVDRAVLAAATGRTTRGTVPRETRSGMPLRWRVIKWGGVAAAVVLALIVPTQLSRNSQGPVVVAGDFNRDGVIDILDAFVLARAQRDGDGSITKAEIDAAVARAVALRPVAGGGA